MFYGLTFALAGVWALGALESASTAPRTRAVYSRNQRPVISGTVIGLALGAVFVVGGLLAREIPGTARLRRPRTAIRDARQPAAVVVITLVNGPPKSSSSRRVVLGARKAPSRCVISTIVVNTS